MSNKNRNEALKNIRARDIAKTNTKAGREVPKSIQKQIRDSDKKMGK